MSHRSRMVATVFLLVTASLMPYNSGSLLSAYSASKVSKIQTYLGSKMQFADVKSVVKTLL